MSRKLIAGIGIAVAGLFLAGCGDDVEGKDREAANKAHEQMQKSQGAKTMKYSPTREIINFYVDTWDEPGKLAYVYLQNPDGDMLGYYVLEGPPVSFCSSISPTYTFDSGKWQDSEQAVPAPANDGAYHSGGDCSRYYGKDATTGAYIEYTAGLGINVLLFDQPLPNSNGIQALSGTTVEDVEE